MRIAVIGASAGVGLEVVKLALQRGHEVTSLSRHLEPLPDDAHLHKIKGSSSNENDLRLAVHGVEAILVTLGTGKSTKATSLFSDSARILLKVLQESERQPLLIVLTGFGAGKSGDYNSLTMKVFFYLFLKEIYADKSEMERMISNGYPSYEIVRPGMLTNGRLTGRYTVQNDLTKGMKVRSISRMDVADFMVRQAEHPTHIGKYPAISY